MSWTVVNQIRSDGRPFGITYPLRNESSLYLTLIVPSRQTLAVTSRAEGALGKLTVGSWGVSLESLVDGLHIIPGGNDASTSLDPQVQGYKLRPSSDSHTEVILLRNGDKIRSSHCTSDLVCQWQPSEIQVNSSAAADPKTAVGETPEDSDDETENEDLDVDVSSIRDTQSKSQPARATPVPSVSRSVVVQETPAAERVNGWTAFTSTSQTSKNHDNSVDYVLSQDDAPFSTAKSSVPKNSASKPTAGLGDLATGKPSTKRASPIEKERPNKRTKKMADEDSSLQDVVDTSRRSGAASKGRTRLSDDTLQDHTVLSSAASTATYEGSKPHVAFSNSAITEKSTAMKFLKRRGVLLTSVKDECNYLCVRAGALSKTPKLLKSIAHGITIVTDKWLLDSANAGEFLPKDQYMPAVAEQEQEWGFSLANIYEKPQSSLFADYTIVFTPALKGTYKDFKEMEEVCKAVGATKVISRKKGPNDENEKTIILAKEEGDEDASKLMQDGKTCYTKDLLVYSILRGAVDLESDEFKIRPAGVTTPALAPPSTKGKKGRPRKSLS